MCCVAEAKVLNMTLDYIISAPFGHTVYRYIKTHTHTHMLKKLNPIHTAAYLSNYNAKKKKKQHEHARPKGGDNES